MCYQFSLCLVIKMEASDEETFENILLFAMLLRRRRFRREQAKKPRKVWVKTMFKLRRKKGAFTQLVKEMRRSDREEYFRLVPFYELVLTRITIFFGEAQYMFFCK